jgi:hypothetical protein
MWPKENYYTLIGSLPALPSHFEDAERVPISSRGLDERLKMLDPDAAEVIKQLGDFLLWDRQPLDRTDDEFCRHYERIVASVNHRFVRDIVEEVMTRRTILSGLRRRRLGWGPPTGVAWVARHITQHWAHPDFRLAARFPWIVEMDAQLCGDSPFELERMGLQIAWTYVKRLADQYQFSFEAVLLYLIRWEIVYRWTRRDAQAGQEKFEQLAAEAMGEFANMFDTAGDTQ